MSYYVDDGKGNLVPAKGEVPQEATAAIERADDQNIVNHLTSDFASDNFIYNYPIKGGQVTGIGVDGAKEIARLLGNIEVLPDIRLDKDSDPDYIYAMVRAKDLLRNVTMLGVGRQCKYYVGEGNIPTDRLNEFAFVISINKGIRNAILAVAPQEAIAKIIQGFKEQNKIKNLPPSYHAAQKLQPAKAAPARVQAPATATTEEDTLKKLRQQVGIEAGKVFPTDDARKVWQKMEYGVDSMTELDKHQLEDMLAKVKAMSTEAKESKQPAKANVTRLGFSSEDEQTQMRRHLLSLVDDIGYKTDAEKRQYVAEKGWQKTNEVTKDKLESYIKEVEEVKKAIDEAGDISENI